MNNALSWPSTFLHKQEQHNFIQKCFRETLDDERLVQGPQSPVIPSRSCRIGVTVHIQLATTASTSSRTFTYLSFCELCALGGTSINLLKGFNMTHLDSMMGHLTCSYSTSDRWRW